MSQYSVNTVLLLIMQAYAVNTEKMLPWTYQEYSLTQRINMQDSLIQETNLS